MQPGYCKYIVKKVVESCFFSVPAPKINPSLSYYIVSDSSGTVVDTSDTCSSSNCPIVANAKQPGQRQLWRINPFTNTSYYTISNVAKTGQCLSLVKSDSQLGLDGCKGDLTLFSLQWNENRTPALGWRIVPKSQPSVSVKLVGGSKKNNTPIKVTRRKKDDSGKFGFNELWMFNVS